MPDVGFLAFLSATSVVLLFAVCSNALVIYCVIRIKKLRTVTNVFICNLSVSDILLAGVVIPQRLHDAYYHMDDYIEGKAMFHFYNYLSNSYTMGCPPVRGDNPPVLASGLSCVQVDTHGITIL